jgi:uncharacterized coiled-coil protein SlyX
LARPTIVSPLKWRSLIYDADGKPYTVRYEAVNAMLLNEFLKEHRKNEEQEKTIAELKSGMTALAATVKEQAAQIQKVSAQLEASKPAPRVVVNKPQKFLGRLALCARHTEANLERCSPPRGERLSCHNYTIKLHLLLI